MSEQKYTYDSVNFLTQIAHQKSSNLATIAQLDYTRDSIGNITKMTSTRGDFNFVYDSNNQLINSTHPEDVASSFTYDSLGNRITDQLGNYNYDNKRQRLLEDWKYIYAYDNNGNLSSKILKADQTKVTNFIHNSENQLISIKEYNGVTVVKETSYSYDAVGRRIDKVHVDRTNSAKSFTRKFVYDGQEILLELNGSDQILSTFTHSMLRTDDVLAVDKNGTSYFYLKDHLGTVNEIIDSAGNIVQHYVYSPYGKITSIKNGNGVDVTDAPLVDNFYTFTGREFDKESGLYYYRARYFDSETGRFIQGDPHNGELINPLTFISKYLYVLNNPIMNLDPTGKDVVPPSPGDIQNAFGTISVVLSFPTDFANALLFQRGSFLKNLSNNMINSGKPQGALTTLYIVPELSLTVKIITVAVYAIIHFDVLEARIERFFRKIKKIF